MKKLIAYWAFKLFHPYIKVEITPERNRLKLVLIFFNTRSNLTTFEWDGQNLTQVRVSLFD